MQGLYVLPRSLTMNRMSEDERKTFWQRLREAYFNKHRENLTQKKAAALVKATQGAGKRWAHGGFPKMEHAIMLAEKLDVSVEWLLTGRGEKKPLSAQEQQLVAYFRSLPSEEARIKLLGHLEWSLRTKPVFTDAKNDVNDACLPPI